jgi:hypothetical protein
MKYPQFTGDEPCAQIGGDLFSADDISKRYHDTKRLRQICGSCPMQEPCLDYALHVKVEGFWGGTTDGERAKIRRARGIKPSRLREIA